MLEDPLIPWILAVGALAVVAILAVTVTSLQRRLARTSRDLTSARKDLEEIRRRSEGQGDQLRRRNDEVQDLRRRLEKAKKRAASARKSQSEEGGRVAALETETRQARAHAKEARAEADRLVGEVEGLRKELEAARAEARRKGAPAKEKPRPDPASDDAAETQLRQRIETSERKQQELRKRVTELEGELKKARGRAETNHRIYLVTKGELEAAKDRIKTLESQGGMRAGAESGGAASGT